jgi:hypothetical protein
MKSLQVIPLFALLLLAVGSSLGQLSLDRSVKADVPFAFSVADEQFPAGEYIVSGVGSQGILALRGTGSQMRLVATQAAVSSGPSNKSKLIFHRYGDRYILSEIWLEGDSRGRRLPKTKLEKELAARAKYDSSEVIARK